MIRPPYVNEALLDLTIAEDFGRGDLTTDSTVSLHEKGSAIIMAKESLVVCGIDLAEYLYKKIDPEIKFSFKRHDGEAVIETDIIAVVEGRVNSILKGERAALNFLQRLSGIATKTREYVKEVPVDSATKVVDTRKTTPGWRLLEKYAVRCGGGKNHRFGLDDGVMIKDNHIKAAGSIGKAVEAVRKVAHHLVRVEVETTNISEVKEALEAGADVIMLDNMNNEAVAEAVEVIGGKAIVEVSGGITLERIPDLANLKVDYISVGALTHSAVAKDINLTIEI